MPHTYSRLTDEQRKEMLEFRITQLESEHYNHYLNRLSVEALPDEDPGRAEAIQDADAAMAAIETAIGVCQSELETFGYEGE